MGFDYVSLDEYFDLVSPGVRPFKGTKRYIATGSLDTGRITSFEEVDYDSRPTRANMEAVEGDILFAKMKDTEKVFVISKEDAENLYSTGFVILRIKDKSEFTPNFIYYWVKSKEFQALKNKECTGATQKAIGETKIRCFKVPKPAIGTQKKIVSILEKAESLKEMREGADKLTDELLKSIFYEMFGDLNENSKRWEIKPFAHFAKIDTRMTTNFDDYKNQPHIGIDNIEKETGELSNYRAVATQNLISGKYIFTGKHIIYSKIRPNLNKVALPDFDGLCSADAYPILVYKEHSNKYFFAYILRSKYFLSHVLSCGRRANIPKVNKEEILKFKCINPPIDLQNKFGKIAENIINLKKKQKQGGSNTENFVRVLMQKAFNGELVG